MNLQPGKGHQQSGNGCSHPGPNQNHKSQHVEGLDAQALPMPIPDLAVQYSKVSYQGRVMMRSIQTLQICLVAFYIKYCIR